MIRTMKLKFPSLSYSRGSEEFDSPPDPSCSPSPFCPIWPQAARRLRVNRTRATHCSCTCPLTLFLIKSWKNQSCCIQAGCLTQICSVPRSKAHGTVCAAIVSPTTALHSRSRRQRINPSAKPDLLFFKSPCNTSLA